jgi:hypothetical protein
MYPFSWLSSDTYPNLYLHVKHFFRSLYKDKPLKIKESFSVKERLAQPQDQNYCEYRHHI